MNNEIIEIRSDSAPLTGILTFVGDLNVNDEEVSGVMIDINRANLIAAKSLPMYERCVVITEEKYRELINNQPTNNQ
jgi:hypothetical protein